jgi:hypothetical protein
MNIQDGPEDDPGSLCSSKADQLYETHCSCLVANSSSSLVAGTNLGQVSKHIPFSFHLTVTCTLCNHSYEKRFIESNDLYMSQVGPSINTERSTYGDFHPMW